MIIFTGRQNHNGASASHEAKILTIVRIFWVALIVFLFPRLAFGSGAHEGNLPAANSITGLRQGLIDASRLVREACVQDKNNASSPPPQGLGLPQGATYPPAREQACTNVLTAIADASSSAQAASHIGASNVTARAPTSPGSQTAAAAACGETADLGTQSGAFTLQNISQNGNRIQAAGNNEDLPATARPGVQAALNALASAGSMDAAQMRATMASAAACGRSGSGLDSAGGRRGGSGETDNTMRNLQIAQMGLGAVNSLSGLFKKDDKAGGGGGNGSMPDVAPFNMPFDSLADSDGDGIPDRDEQPSTSLTATGPANGVAASAVGFSAASTGSGGQVGTSPVGSGLSNASVSDAGAGADFARPEELGSSGSAGGGFGSSGGGGSSSGGSAGANTSGASTAATAGDKAAETPASGETPTNGGGSSLLGMGGDSGGLGDLMGGFKNPFEAAPETPGSGSALIGASQPLGGEAPEAKPERVLASTADNSMAKESLFGRVSDRLSLACERAELRCQKPKRIQGEI